MPPVIVDVLDAGSYAERRIKGSINIPHKDVPQLAPVALPDKNAEVVVSCASYRCPASTQAAQSLKKLGHARELDYKGGMKERSDKGLPWEGNLAAKKD